MVRYDDLPAVELLETVKEHGTVLLLKELLAHDDPVVGVNGEEIAVEGGMVELAEREAVRNSGLPFRVSIGNDVRSVQ